MFFSSRSYKIDISLIKITTFKLGIIVLCVIFLIFPQPIHQGMKSGINQCLNILIPSLFPFMVMASFIAQSQFFSKPSKILSKITEFLFYLPGCSAPIIFLSLIGGYPVGAQGVKSLFKNKSINSEQLNRMMCFCVNAGPAFTISVIGGLMIHNVFTGIVIFIIQILLSLSIGVILGIHARLKNKKFYYKYNITFQNYESKISESFINSITKASISLFDMCALIIFFSGLTSILKNTSNQFLNFKIPFGKIKVILISLLEITNGCAEAANTISNPVIIAIILGYGGLCVHLQIASVLKKTPFNFKRFYLARLINSIASGILLYISLNVLKPNVITLSLQSMPKPTCNSSSTYGSIALILLSLYFIITINHKVPYLKPLKQKHIKK